MRLYPPGIADGQPVPAYRSRWDGVEGRAFSREIWRRLRERQSLSGLDLGEVDGRLDLRAIPLPSTRMLSEVGLESMDFTEASLELMELTLATVTDCRFDGAMCVDWRLWGGVEVTRCTFRDAELGNSVLGSMHAGRGNRFQTVDFTGARMESVSTSAAEYLDCDFSDARLSGVNFWQSSLIRCRFAGRLVGVIFDGRDLGEAKPPNPMSDVDFSGARMDGCSFRGVSFERVRLPDDPDLMLFPDAVQLLAAIDALEPVEPHDPQSEPALARRVTRSILAKLTGAVLVNVRDFGRASETYRELLARARMMTAGS